MYNKIDIMTSRLQLQRFLKYANELLLAVITLLVVVLQHLWVIRSFLKEKPEVSFMNFNEII